MLELRFDIRYYRFWSEKKETISIEDSGRIQQNKKEVERNVLTMRNFK